jgi:asparagine synthetase B (glutamine-hydrolysing)
VVPVQVIWAGSGGTENTFAEILEATRATTIEGVSLPHALDTTSQKLRSISYYMCGIYFSLCRGDLQDPEQETTSTLQARGPDSFRIVKVIVPPCQPLSLDHNLTFCASVLALRGDGVQVQPLVDQATGSILCWNGEAWKKDGHKVTGNDSLVVFEALLSAASEQSPSTSISAVLTSFTGPFAFVFYDASSSTVYFGRDRLGRRSLILQRQGPDHLTICSVSTPASGMLEEVSTDVIHALSFENCNIVEQQIPWPNSAPSINTNLPNISALGSYPRTETIQSLLSRLAESLKLRVLDVPAHGRLNNRHGAAKIAILFSGGLDCTLVGRMVHDILPLAESIDLLNVAFENPRAMKARAAAHSPYETCPDRITGRASFSELLQTCPGRCWRFVTIDVPYSEAIAHKHDVLRLIRPHNTEMDLSITLALYFAARGHGEVRTMLLEPGTSQPYSTSARVLLSGLGADELFGGYSRHAKAFEGAGFPALIEELDLDFKRIGKRNLGRDDRVISHWAREVRYPYLDEDFVRFALGLPVWEKCGFRIGRPIPKHYDVALQARSIENLDPSKMLLRVALWSLGMKSAAAERKRAIQFGAKTAKMEMMSGRRKGTEAVEAG